MDELELLVPLLTLYSPLNCLALDLFTELLHRLSGSVEYLPVDCINLATVIIVERHEPYMMRLEYKVFSYKFNRDYSRTEDHHRADSHEHFSLEVRPPYLFMNGGSGHRRPFQDSRVFFQFRVLRCETKPKRTGRHYERKQSRR